MKLTEAGNFDPEEFSRQIYDQLYRGTSTSAVHGLGPAARHFDSETSAMLLRPKPSTKTDDDYASALFSAIALPAATLSALGDAVAIDIVDLDKFNASWRQLLVDE